MKLDSLITVDKGEMSRKEWERLLVKLTFRDADDQEVYAYQYLSGKDQMLLPRGALDMLPSRLDVTDLRSCPAMPKYEYVRELDAPGYEGQRDAVLTMGVMQQGQVIAPPGSGKTEICLAFIALAKTRTLVVVHTQDLMRQWQDRAAASVPGMPVGKIQGKTCQVEHLTIAMAQTLRGYLDAGGKFWRQFGAIIVDEAHHAAAETWEWLLNVCPAFYRFGVTASEKRSDGRQALVRFNIGPVIYKLKFKSGVPMTVVPIKSGFKTKYNGTQYQRIMTQVVRDVERNRRIAKIADREIGKGHSVLVLSRQIKHLENIYAALDDKEHAVIVTGKIARAKRDKMIEALADGSLRCILGTQLFEEGVDIPRLNRIVLAYPGTEITALQKIGRGSRQFDGKTETIVYDILDDFVQCLVKQFIRRRTWYRSVNIDVGKVVDYGKKRKGKNDRPEAPQGRKLLDRLRPARPRRS